MPVIVVSVQIVACVLLADLLSGLVHWLEDAYGREDLPVVGELVTRRNNLHHQDPAYFARFSYWHSSWLLIALCATAGGVAALCGAFTWQLGVVLVLCANANQVHKWTHRPRSRNGRVVGWLMDARLIQSQRDHALHHRGEETTHYCVLTPHLNPLLERLGLWRRLERLVARVTGVERRDPRRGRLPRALERPAGPSGPERGPARGDTRADEPARRRRPLNLRRRASAVRCGTPAAAPRP